MTQTADGAGVRAPRRARAATASALFVVVREERGSTDIRFIGAFHGSALQQLPDVLRQIMRRAPAFIHLDLRDVDAVDDEGLKQLAHAARICRRHGGMVKISVSPSVERAAEDAGASASLGILPRTVREKLSTSSDGDGNGSRSPAPRY